MDFTEEQLKKNRYGNNIAPYAVSNSTAVGVDLSFIDAAQV